MESLETENSDRRTGESADYVNLFWPQHDGYIWPP